MDEARGSHRTRSKAAPDWTTEESIILIDEINAVESEWGETLPSFQRWQQIVENCNTLDVNRNLNQCKRQWEALLGDYRRVKEGVGASGLFPVELLEAIDRCVTAKGKKNEGSGEVEVTEGEQAVIDTDVDSDPGEKVQVKDAFPGPGSKRQRHRMKRKRGRVERKKPWGYYTSIKTIHGESSNINVKLAKPNNINVNDPWRNIHKCITKVALPKETNADKEKRMATDLWENALQINRLLDGNSIGDMHTTDLKNAVETEFIRQQGDELINYLGKISATLNQLSDLVQQH